MISRAEDGRSAGFLAKHASTTELRDLPALAGRGGGGSWRWAKAVAMGVGRSNGLTPLSISWATTPRQ